MNKIILSCPLNQLSLGQVSFNIIRELYNRKIQCVIFPKGNVDLSAYKVDTAFGGWISHSINNRFTKLDRSVPTLAIWHIQDSQFKPSDHQFLFSFHECDQATNEEINIVNQQERTFFSSNWTVDTFRTFGAAKVDFIPLGFDPDFNVIPARLVSDDITHWVLGGTKSEQRKNTELIVRTWIKRYGGNRAHQLTLAINNPFFQPAQMEGYYHALGVHPSNKPFNVSVLPHLKTNAEMNQLYNSADICLAGLSSSEAWNLPSFMTTALGKWSIVTNATAHKDWATKDNSILVETTDIREVYDGVFFAKGSQFSQGNIPSIRPEQVEEAFGRAEKLAKTPNPAGRKLAEQFTYKRTVDEILAKMEAA